MRTSVLVLTVIGCATAPVRVPLEVPPLDETKLDWGECFSAQGFANHRESFEVPIVLELDRPLDESTAADLVSLGAPDSVLAPFMGAPSRGRPVNRVGFNTRLNALNRFSALSFVRFIRINDDACRIPNTIQGAKRSSPAAVRAPS